MQFSLLLLNFLKWNIDFASKLTLGLCQLHQQNKSFLFTTPIKMKKLLSDSRNLTKND